MVRLSCLNCGTTRRIPAPPLSPGDSDPPPDPGSTMQVDVTEVEGKRRKRPKTNVAYKQPFFERPEHILFRGNRMVVQVEDSPSHETIGQVPEPDGIETDAAIILTG